MGSPEKGYTLFYKISVIRLVFLKRLHTESGYGLPSGVWPTTCSLCTGSVGRIRVNFLGFDRLPA